MQKEQDFAGSENLVFSIIAMLGLAMACLGCGGAFFEIGKERGEGVALGQPAETLSSGTYRVLHASKTVAENHVLLLVRNEHSGISSQTQFIQLPVAVFPEDLQFGELLNVRGAILDGKAQKTFWFANPKQNAQSGGWS